MPKELDLTSKADNYLQEANKARIKERNIPTTVSLPDNLRKEINNFCCKYNNLCYDGKKFLSTSNLTIIALEFLFNSLHNKDEKYVKKILEKFRP